MGDTGDTVDAFETLAFGVCNTDGIEGLSWDEVKQCEVSKHEYVLFFNHLDILVLLKYVGSTGDFWHKIQNFMKTKIPAWKHTSVYLILTF